MKAFTRFTVGVVLFCVVSMVAVPPACAADSDSAPNQLTAGEKAGGWRLLFDGKTTAGWRNYKKETIGAGWKVEDGALVRKASGAGDILTVDSFGAFELVLEYRIEKGGNSGLMFHVTEQADTPWMTGPEIQIQDNVDGHDPQKSGWLYQFYTADTDATKPAGQWNQLRVLLTPAKSTVWMNGVKYYDFVKGSSDWNERLAKSKFASMPHFGKPTKGFISLQDHGDEVAFRSVKIRAIESTE